MKELLRRCFFVIAISIGQGSTALAGECDVNLASLFGKLSDIRERGDVDAFLEFFHSTGRSLMELRLEQHPELKQKTIDRWSHNLDTYKNYEVASVFVSRNCMIGILELSRKRGTDSGPPALEVLFVKGVGGWKFVNEIWIN